MSNLVKTNRPSKAPLIFLSLIAVLVISTIVVASDYFLRPQIEAELEKTSTNKFAITSNYNALKTQKQSELINK